MPDKSETRQNLVAAASELMQQRGYHGMGINDVLKRTGAPSGSLYHFFPGGKEALAIAAIEASGDSTAAEMREAYGRSSDIREAARVMVGAMREHLVESGYKRGCPVATVVLEIASENDNIQQACRRVYLGWEEIITGALVENGLAAEQAPEMTGFILSTIEGALVFSRAHRSPRYIDEALARVLRELDAALPAL